MSVRATPMSEHRNYRLRQFNNAGGVGLVHRKYQSGFSLLELMVVIAVMGVVTALAAPSISSMLERQRNKSTANTIVTALKEARAESQLRRTNVTVNLTNDAISLTDGVGGGTLIKNYAISSNAPVDAVAGASTIIFLSNKQVSPETTYTTYCDTNKTKKGRVIKVDVHGNVSVDTGDSQC